MNERLDMEFIKRCKDIPCTLYEAEREKNIVDCAKWRKDNPKKMRACQSFPDIKRRFKNKNLTLDIPENQREAIYLFYLNCPEGYEVDHIQPITKGGKHELSNLQYLTRLENNKKQNKWNPGKNHNK